MEFNCERLTITIEKMKEPTGKNNDLTNRLTIAIKNVPTQSRFYLSDKDIQSLRSALEVFVEHGSTINEPKV